MSPLHHLLRQHATALLKAGSYYGVHIVVAAAVAYAVTGNWLAALTLSLLEPSVQVVAYFLHDKAWARVPMARYRTLLKTVSYYGVHLVVAAGVAYAVTGDGVAALTLSLLEPTVQVVAYFLHDKAWARVPMARYRTLLKTVSYYGVHLVVAAGVAYAVTGDWVAALTLSLLEPTVQMLFFYLHETLWERQAQRRPSAAGPCAAAVAGPQLPVCGHRSVLQHA